MSETTQSRPMPSFDPDPEREPRRIILYMITLIALILLSVLLWACLAELDVAVSARGSVTPPSRLQEVQSLEGGIVRELLAKQGQIVRRGEVLVRLDTVQYDANLGASRQNRYAALAGRARLDALLADSSPQFEADWEREVPALIAKEKQLWIDAKREYEAAGLAGREGIFTRRRVEPGGANGVDGQQHLGLALLGLAQEGAGRAQLVLLHPALAHLPAARLEEGVGHGAADEEGVDAAEQVLEHADLVGHLGAAHHGQVGAVHRPEQLSEELQLAQHEEAGALDRHVLDHARRRGVRAVRGAEGVVHVDLGVGGERAAEGVVVVLLAGVEAQVLQHRHLPVAQVGHHLARPVAHRLVGEDDVAAEQGGEARGGRLQRVRRVGIAVGTAQVRGEDHPRVVIDEVGDGGHRGGDARVVGHAARGGERHVEVDAHEHPLALHGQVGDGADPREIEPAAAAPA